MMQDWQNAEQDPKQMEKMMEEWNKVWEEQAHMFAQSPMVEKKIVF